MNCQIEFGSSDSDIGTPCGKTAVAECADCGSSISSNCRTECCGDSFCDQCYDYHLTHFCVRKPVQNERHYPTPSPRVKPHTACTPLIEAGRGARKAERGIRC